MDNILAVTVKPPPMLIAETNAAILANVCGKSVGKYCPPIRSIPPTAVMPEMALVTDIRGEWRAGVTPQTVWYPTIPAKPKVVTMVVKAGLGEIIPRPGKMNSILLKKIQKLHRKLWKFTENFQRVILF